MTGPVTTEALVGELAKAIHLSLHPGGNFEMARDNQSPGWMAADALAEQIAADFIAPLLAAHQQITAERDEYAEALMKVAEVGGWQASAGLAAEVQSRLARLRAEGEAKDKDNAATALMVIALCNSVVGNAYIGKDGEEALAGHVKAAFMDAALARAATAREGA